MTIGNFLRDAFTYAIPTILSRGVGLLLLPLYARYLTPAEYGVVELLTIVYVLLNLVLPLEVSQAVARFSPEVRDAAQKGNYVSTAFSFTALVFGMLIIVAWTMPANVRAGILESKIAGELFPLAALWMATNALFYIVLNQLRWDRRPRAYAATSVVFTLVTAAVSVALIAGFGLAIEGYLWGQGAGSLAGLLTGLAWLRSTTRVQLTLNGEDLRHMLAFSAPLVLSSIAVYLALYVDRWLLFAWRGDEQLGIYAVAFRIASIVTLALAGVQLAITPMIYAHYQSPETPAVLRKIFRYCLLGACLLVLFASAFATEIVWVVAGRQYEAAGQAVGWLCLGTVLANVYLFAPGLILAKRTKTIALISMMSATVNAAISYVLIPPFGAIGSALGMMAAAATSAALYVSLGERHYRISHDWRRSAVALLVVPAIALLQDLDLAWRLVVMLIASVVIASVLFERADLRVLDNRLSSLRSR